MNRDEAWTLLGQHLKNRNLLKHSLAVEACMRDLAGRFGENPEKWGTAGLLHDLDYEYTVNDPEAHTLKTVEILDPLGVDGDVLHAIQAHNLRAEPNSKMDIALYSVDPATGFVTACALMHPGKKLQALDLAFLKKRFKEKSFAKGASREQMSECVKLGVTLDEFLEWTLAAMRGIDFDLGL